MTPVKRLMDIVLALLLAIPGLPLGLLIALWIKAGDGGDIFYPAERAGQDGRPFTLWKFRTMCPAAQDAGVSGGDKAARITPAGRVLRRFRLDELPQLWNILAGQMSFVGPRPPLMQYVRQFPDLYGDVLQMRPGITGLATLHFHAREAQLLAECTTAAETEAVYCRRCIPVKARLDLIYARNRTICRDFVILGKTITAVLR